MVSLSSLPQISPSLLLFGPKAAVRGPSIFSPRRIGFRLRRISAVYTSPADKVWSHIVSPPESLYEVLGIQMNATCQEIKTAYRRLARVSHPDVATSGRKDTSADEFMKIHAAYATLSDPEKRAEYDRTVFRRRRRVSSTPFVMSASDMPVAGSSDLGFSGYTRRRTWETDQCW